MPDQHAFLALSASKAWLSCTRMPRFTEGLPDTENEAAFEGTVAHAISEWTLRMMLRMNSEKYCRSQIKKYKETVYPDLGLGESGRAGEVVYDKQMSRHVRDYVSYVMEQYSQALRIDPGAQIFIETRVDVSKYVPEGFGTADVIIVYKINGRGRYIGIDLKYGKGVLVEGEDNPQLKLYALGGAILLDPVWDFEFFEMHIYQPRLNNFPIMEISRQTLINWARYVVKPKAQLAWDGEGEFVVGDYCRFCKAFAKCPAVYEKAQRLAMHKFARIEYLPPEAVSEVYKMAQIMTSWLAETKRDALEMSLKHGVEWPDLILTNARAERKYSNPDALAERLLAEGYSEEEIYKRSMIGILALEELLGSKFEKVTAGLIEKPAGAPTLKVDDGKIKPYNKADGKFKDLTKKRD
jgi:hypothetical protein